MADVQKFNAAMLEHHLKRNDLKYLTDRDGDFIVQFAESDDTGCELVLMLAAAGPRKEILTVRLQSNKKYPRGDWPKIIFLCNKWNKEKRWPKAFLHVDDYDTDATGTLMLEEQIDLEQGIHQELLDDFVQTVISGAHSCIVWVHKEHGL